MPPFSKTSCATSNPKIEEIIIAPKSIQDIRWAINDKLTNHIPTCNFLLWFLGIIHEFTHLTRAPQLLKECWKMIFKLLNKSLKIIICNWSLTFFIVLLHRVDKRLTCVEAKFAIPLVKDINTSPTNDVVLHMGGNIQ